jgi:predicted adenylyl cyclase CyaB
MSWLNVEIKARCADLEAVAARLAELGARFVGLDRQVDTYFNCPDGRLKLRVGTIERALIHYRRPDIVGLRDCRVTLERLPPDVDLRPVLAAALGIAGEVVKARRIYFLDNVKVHLDRVEGLGTFVEIEAIDADGSRGAERLTRQCRELMAALAIAEGDLLAGSYRDML